MMEAIAAVAALLKEVFGFVFKNPTDKKQDIDNKERLERNKAESDARKFAAEMRRFLSKKRMVLLALLLLSCAHTPLTTDERSLLTSALERCEKENEQLREYLNQCLDKMDNLEKCSAEIEYAAISSCR